MRKKVLSMSLVAVMAFGLLAGCGAKQEAAPAEPAAEEEATEEEATEEEAAEEATEEVAADAKDASEYTIVMCAKHEGISWFDDMRIGIEEFAADTGVNAYQIAPEGGDPAKQLQMVEDLIAQGVDAICVVPNDAQSMAPALQKARDAGIVVIGHEAPDILDSVDYDLAAFTNASHGERFGENLAANMNNEGKFASLVGMLTMVPHMEWWQGCVDYVAENAPDMELINAEPYEDKNDNQIAYDKAVEVIKANPDIMGFTDSAASGAGIAQALQERERNDIALVSTAVPSQAGEYIRSGFMDAGLAWRPADAGYVTCMIALKVLQGEAIESGMDFGKDGYTNVRVEGNAIFGEAPLVFTADNIDEPQFAF
ncbi:MAG: substrate-binding domain-containing protein [Lachnospiraceae bacterium]|nr:substrate-binding domain-containing protein [Candidatus Equihabitans merdae]